MSDELMELPEGWEETNLGEIVLSITYGHTASSTETPVGPKFLRITDLQNNSVDWDTVPYCECDSIEKYKLKKGDIVVARTGATTGKSFLIQYCPEPTVFASYLIRLQTSTSCSPEYLAAFMQSTNYWKQITTVSKGTAQPGANASILASLSIPLPPLNEQKRIVARIEELRERSQKARSALSAIPELCDKFRQSVLAAAFRGYLTADWREQNPDIEPASVLLDSLKKRSPQLDSDLDEYDLLDLPASWIWVNIDSISDVKGGKRLPKGEKLLENSTGYPYIKAGNLKNGTVILDDIEYVPTHIQPLIKNYIVAAGDVYITIVGACIGDAGTIPKGLDGANLTENAAKICNLSNINNEYLALWLRSPICQEIIKTKILSAAQGKLALTRIKTIPVPLAPVQEQAEIVAKSAAILKSSAQMTELYEKFQTALDWLDRSILAKAFRGELVEQDPNDEPASVLLERIRAEREQTPGKTKKPGKKKGQRTIKTE